jgi:hypothetical protein
LIIVAKGFKSRGFFWWLGDATLNGKNIETTGVPGLLTVSKDGEIELKLDGELPYPVHPSKLRPAEAGLLPQGRQIIGKLTDDNRDIAILDSLLLSKYPWLSASPRSQSYIADYCLLGSGATEIQHGNIIFSRFRVELKGLAGWLNLSGISGERNWDDAASVSSTVSCKNFKFEYARDGGNLLVETVISDPFWSLFFPQHPGRKAVFAQTDWLEYAPPQESSIQSMYYEFI